MAQEAVIITYLGNNGDPVEFIVATGTAIPKGTLMQLSSSPQTATATSADGDHFVGITDEEKTATDGKVKIALITNCIAKIYATATTGSMVLGEPVKIKGANTVAPADDATVAHQYEVVGMALETVAHSDSGAVWVGKA